MGLENLKTIVVVFRFYFYCRKTQEKAFLTVFLKNSKFLPPLLSLYLPTPTLTLVSLSFSYLYFLALLSLFHFPAQFFCHFFHSLYILSPYSLSTYSTSTTTLSIYFFSQFLTPLPASLSLSPFSLYFLILLPFFISSSLSFSIFHSIFPLYFFCSLFTLFCLLPKSLHFLHSIFSLRFLDKLSPYTFSLHFPSTLFVHFLTPLSQSNFSLSPLHFFTALSLLCFSCYFLLYFLIVTFSLEFLTPLSLSIFIYYFLFLFFPLLTFKFLLSFLYFFPPL